MKKTIRQLQDYLTQNDPQTALTQLRNICAIAGSELLNDVIILSGQFKKLQSDTRKGIIDYQQENLRYNQIMNAILSLLDEMKNHPQEFVAYQHTQNQLQQALRDKGQPRLPLKTEDALFQRMAYVKEKKISVNALWIDDHPDKIQYESSILRTLGVQIEVANTSAAADALIHGHLYDFIISDIQRSGIADEGLRYHQQLVTRGIDLPTIFYIRYLDRKRGMPPYTFGMAHLPNDLLHLVLDIIERKY